MRLPGRRATTTAPTVTKAKDGTVPSSSSVLYGAASASLCQTNSPKTSVRLAAASSQAL
jgi:hypothetical protein